MRKDGRAGERRGGVISDKGENDSSYIRRNSLGHVAYIFIHEYMIYIKINHGYHN
jgi:hypothetical protein